MFFYVRYFKSIYISVAREVAAAKLRKEAEQKMEQKSDSQIDMGFPLKLMNGSNADIGSFKRKDEELQESNKKTKLDEKPKVLEKLKVQDKTRPVSSTPVEGTPWYVYYYVKLYFCSDDMTVVI